MNRRLAVSLLLLILATVPMFGARGSADFTRFVAIGDSYGAGVVSNSLNVNHQVYSWPAMIARQAGVPLCSATASPGEGCFAQPLISYPGIGPELVLSNLAPTIVPASGLGSPMMLSFGRPFNNLAIPGLRVREADMLRGSENATTTATTFAQMILRGQGTSLDQAIALRPTFVAIWLGGNDVLGSAQAGTDKLMTPVADFRAAYAAMLDKLIAGAPAAGMVVGTLPRGEAGVLVPFFTAVTTSVNLGGMTVPLIGDLGNGVLGPLPSGSRVLLSARTDISQGYGLPAATGLPFAGQPLADRHWLSPAEISALKARIDAYNDVIRTEAAARNIPVADIAGLFDDVLSGHMVLGGIPITGSYLLGGFFSYDGFHLTDIGYTLFANEYIEAINDAYDKEIPAASITQFFTNNGAFFPEARTQWFGPIELSAEAAAEMQKWYGGGTTEAARPRPLPRGRLRTGR